jgi:oligopeptidase B
LSLLAAAVQSPTPEPPIAEIRPHEVVAPHGHKRIDPYYWLQNRDDPAVLAYLRAENDYTERTMAHTAKLRDQLFEEMRGRVKETDETAPYRQGRYLYYTRQLAGKEYPVHVRRRAAKGAAEEVMIDGNERGAGHEFYEVAWDVSSGENILAVAEDTLGRNIVTIRFRDLQTGKWLTDVIPEASWRMAWAQDNRTLFYVTRESETLREYRVYRHVLGTDPAKDVLVYEEPDDTYFVSVEKTKSRRYMLIGSHHTLATEWRYTPAEEPDQPFTLFAPRKRGHEHEIDHHGDHFYVRSNDGAKNFRLMRARIGNTAQELWEEVIPHRADVLLEGIDAFRDHLVVTERKDGLPRLRIRPWSGKGDHAIAFDEAAYLAYLGPNPEFDAKTVRFEYESLATPHSVYDYNPATRRRTLKKRQEILGSYRPADYHAERKLVTARDGVRVPVSLVYKKALKKKGPQPLLLYGYGAYGASTDPWFSPNLLSLLDRGFVFAMAHVRGGQELGRDWYEKGRMQFKKNSFHDFMDVAENLVSAGYTAKDRIFAQGGSAGGLLVSAVVTLRPDLFRGVIADVPFVDVVTTMLDESVPLTTFEWDEWGDPRKKPDYDYMLSYSPYDNVASRSYPNLLVTAGLHDSQVQYWEPAKWVAKLRATRTGDSRLLLKTNMEAGHGGAAGRYQRWKEVAFEHAFLLDLVPK